MYTKKEYYENMRKAFIEVFGENYKDIPTKDLKRMLKSGIGPKINWLYKDAVYDCRLFGGAYGTFRNEYDIWQYERLKNTLKYL